MIVAIHQPSYLPWLGYLDRMARADVFVVLKDYPFPFADDFGRQIAETNRIPYISEAELRNSATMQPASMK
jgi:hypothetical protein